MKSTYAWDLKALLKVIKPFDHPHKGHHRFRPDQVFTDTRKPVAGGLFVALQGENFDGHDFIGNAVTAGAKGFIVQRDVSAAFAGLEDEGELAAFDVYRVEDTLHALGDLAADYRRSMATKVIAITGSNGKTTCRHIVEQTFVSLGLTKTAGTKGNLNNLIGVPLTILAQPPDLDFLVLELGMNVPGEIARLTEITLPDTVVITSVSASHIGFFQSVEDIAQAKLEIISDTGRPIQAWLPTEPAFVRQMAEQMRPDLPFFTVPNSAPGPLSLETKSHGPMGTEGRRQPVHYPQANPFAGLLHRVDGTVCNRTTEGFEINLRDTRFKTNLQTVFQVNYLLLGLWLAGDCGATWPTGEVKLHFDFPSGRFHIAPVTGTGRIIIDDSYNGNPASMRAAFGSARELFPQHRRIAVLGKMAELGVKTDELHELTGRYAAENGIAAVWTTGPAEVELYIHGFSQAGGPSADCVYRADWEDFCEQAAERVAGFDENEPVVFIVKGSRSSAMERIVDILKDGRY